ncbi:MAG TPA: tripartite tricarboxylate transporter substrate-binding protein [Burkholderiaceae bacterium]|nr:tripartite tricarboxylate transporter substrate-binding protein [Burkholderiaceae bacterium]
MNWQRRQTILTLTGTGLAGAGLAGSSGVRAQDYPSRPVKLLVGYVPGPVGPDFAARTMAAKLTQLLGQPFVVENKPGAGGTLATAVVAKSPPDGYTLLLGETGQLEIAPYLYKALPYNTLQDLTPLALLTDGAGIVFVSNAKTTQIRTIHDLIREAKANPGKLNYGSAGIGSIHHLIMETFKDGAGVDIAHVPYKGGGQAVPAFLGGEVSILVAALQTVWPHVRSGHANLLAVTAAKRLSVIPDVPSLAEVIPGFGLESQLGLLGPPGMPADVVARLSTATRAALESPDVREKLSAEGTRTLRWSTPQEYTEIIRQNLKKYERAVMVANVRPE